MVRAARLLSASLFALQVSACVEAAQPTEPPALPPKAGPPPEADPLPGPPAFPPVTRPARVFEATAAPYYVYHNSVLLSRYVLFDDGAFSLQYSSGRWGIFEYKGTYKQEPADAAGVHGVTFDWEGWSAAGPWGAWGSIRGDTLTVDYNTIMLLSDFEPGSFVLRR